MECLSHHTQNDNQGTCTKDIHVLIYMTSTACSGAFLLSLYCSLEYILFGFGALTAAVLSAVVLGRFFKANKTKAADCLGVYPLVGALFTMEKSLYVEVPIYMWPFTQ